MAAQPPPVCEVWPEHWPCLRIFLAMETQWRPNFSGLDYAALPAVMEFAGIATEARGTIFAALRVMENEVLNAAAEARS